MDLFSEKLDELLSKLQDKKNTEKRNKMLRESILEKIHSDFQISLSQINRKYSVTGFENVGTNFKFKLNGLPIEISRDQLVNSVTAGAPDTPFLELLSNTDYKPAIYNAILEEIENMI